MRARARDASVEPQWAQPIINWRGSVRAGAPFEMNSHRLTPDMGHPPGDRFGPAPVLSSKDSTPRRDSWITLYRGITIRPMSARVSGCRTITPAITAGLLPLHPQQRTKSAVPWRMALCAKNGPEHLQHCVFTEEPYFVGAGE